MTTFNHHHHHHPRISSHKTSGPLQGLIAQFCINNNKSLEYRHNMEYSQGE